VKVPEASPAQPAPSAYPVLSKDPAEREKQLEAFRGESTGILAMLAAVVVRFTPSQPLTKEEQVAIQGPLEQVLFKYDGAVPCEWQLAIALGMVALPRYPEFKKARDAAKLKGM
jgi:hypothetical protein